MIHNSGFSAGILCDGVAVEHYSVQEESVGVVSCYVASEAGKEFSIQFVDQRRDTETRVDCWIDGNYWTSKRARPGVTLLLWGVRDSPNTRAAFRFSELELVDEDEATGYPANIGVIELKVHRVKRAPHHRYSQRYEHRDIPQIGPVSERSKKGGLHQVSLGSSQVSLWRPTVTRTIYLDGQNHPYAVFRFLYRPRALLQAEGIIPRAVDVSNRPPTSTSTSTAPISQPKRARDGHQPHSGPNSSSSGTAGQDAGEPARVVIDLDSDEEAAPVKRERRSPIRVGDWAGQVIDLTMDSD